MQNWKLTDKKAGLENDGLESDVMVLKTQAYC